MNKCPQWTLAMPGIILLLLIASCVASTPTPPTVQSIVQTAVQTEVVTVQVTVPIVITQVFERIVTITSTPTPRYTPTPTHTPGPPTATPDHAATSTAQAWEELTSPKRDGFYTVGVEIAPGRWESQGTGGDCYWARLNVGQNILDNHFGAAGGTVFIRPTDYEVQFDGCGQWLYVGP